MFLDNKYTRWYLHIVSNPLPRQLNSYVESHPIIPGKNDIVNLTPREHFFCHLLLIKMTKGQEQLKMYKALRELMSRWKRSEPAHRVLQRRFYSYWYQRVVNTIMFSSRQRSYQTKEKMSIAQHARYLRSPMTSETKQKIREAKKGRLLSGEHRQKIRLSALQRYPSEETRRKISEAAKKLWVARRHKLLECKEPSP